MATPSLAMIPSAIADSKVYSVLPNNGDGDFSFNRDSSATRIGQNGLIQEVGFFGSELVNSWTNTDFSSFASNGSNITQMVSTGNGNNCYSLATFTSGKTYELKFTSSQNITAQIRISQNTSLTSPQVVLTNPTSGSNSIIFTATSNYVYIGFMANSSFTDTQITEFIAREIQGDQPRLNYDISNGVVQSCPLLLLELASTNVINYSEDFSQSAWTKNNTTVASGFTSPDGTNNAYLMTDDATDSKHGVYKLDVLSQDGNIYTRSVFIKKGTARYVVLSARHLPTSSGTSWIYDFNINNWVLTGSTGAGQSIEDYGNGWYRLSISHISNSNFNNDFSIGISSGATIADTSYSGVGDTVHIWGAQAEALSYATSYIPTLSGASQTRAAETCNDAGTASTFNSTEGVLYFEGSALFNGGVNRYISLSDNTASNRIQLVFTSTANRISVSGGGNIGGGITAIQYNSYNQTDNNKVAFKYSSSGVKLFVNGLEVGSNNDNATWVSGTLTTLDFAIWNQLSVPFLGNVKDARVYNTALTDNELTTLTTI